MTEARSLGPVGDRISFTLLTGFLGSGKTTILRSLLQLPDMEGTAIVVNEFGEVGLDHLLLESTEEDLVLLQSGCLCCSVRSDLIEALERLLWRVDHGEIPAFQRVVIESTGLADPAPVLHTILNDPELAPRFALDGVVTTLDALNGLATLEAHEESRKQVAVADRILLTKQDLLDGLEDGETRRAELEAALERLNPSAPRIRVDHGDIAKELVFDVALFGRDRSDPDLEGWLRDDAFEEEGPRDDTREGDQPVPHQHGEIQSFCISYDAPMPYRVFEAWLGTLLSLQGPDLLRVKGILNLEENPRPVVIHTVQHAVHPPVELEDWPSSDHRSRIVFITHGIEEEQVDQAFRACQARLVEEGS